MNPLVIHPSEGIARPGDLGATVSGDRLMVPAGAANALMGHGVRTGAELLSLAQTFPSALSEILRWSSDDVVAAGNRLGAQLAPHLDGAPSASTRRPILGLGAHDPAELD